MRLFQRDELLDRTVGHDDVVLAVGMHVVHRHMDALQRAAFLGLFEHRERAVVVDIERRRVVVACCRRIVGAGPKPLPAGVTGFDVVTERCFETRLDAGVKRQQADHDQAGPDRQRAHVVREDHGIASSLTSTASASTKSPLAACTFSTRPARGARRVSSIFIASMTSSSWPSATSSPTLAFTSTTRPGIGAVMRSLPVAAFVAYANAAACR